MSRRIGAGVAALAGVTAVLLALAAPASADVNVTPPASAKVAVGDLVNVELPTPDGFTCDTDWTVTTTGTPGVVEEIPPVFCEDSLATWTAVVGKAKKGSATVTFTVTSSSGQKQSAALTLTMKPTKIIKPAKKPKKPHHDGVTQLAPPVGVG